MLVTLAKQVDISPRACTSTCTRTRVLGQIFSRLQAFAASESCRTSCNLDCFKILDSAPTKYQVKLKEMGKAWP